MTKREIRRAFRDYPVWPVKARTAPPLPPLKLPENWLTQQRLMKLDRILTVLLLLLTAAMIILSLLSVAQAEDSPTRLYVTVADGSWLNGRLEPNAHSSVEARFQAGDTVDVYAVSGTWAKVAGGECGFVWCSIDYLSSTAPGNPPETCTVSADGRVRVRRTPENGKTVRWLNDGDTVTVQCRVDGWAYVGDGYVDERYLNANENGPARQRGSVK